MFIDLDDGRWIGRRWAVLSAADGQLRDRHRAAALGRRQLDREIAMCEMTTFSQRRPELREVPRRQYTAYRAIGSSTGVRVAETRRVSLFSPVLAAEALLARLVAGPFLALLVDPEGIDVDAVLRLLDEMLVPPAADGVPDGDDTRHR